MALPRRKSLRKRQPRAHTLSLPFFLNTDNC